MGQKKTQQTQQTPNLNAGNTVSNKQQPTSECSNVSWNHNRTATTGNPNRGNELEIRRAIQDLLIYHAEPLQQQNNQPTMAIATAAVANDNSEQTEIENNTHSKQW
jgi:hypothetical protein